MLARDVARAGVRSLMNICENMRNHQSSFIIIIKNHYNT